MRLRKSIFHFQMFSLFCCEILRKKTASKPAAELIAVLSTNRITVHEKKTHNEIVKGTLSIVKYKI